MSEISARAQKILAWIQSQSSQEFFIRQASLAEQFGCSRRSIGRALNELKAAGLLVDLNKRAENRCKIYHVIPHSMRNPWIPGPTYAKATAGKQARDDKNTKLTPEAQTQWERYGKTFALVFKMPNLQTYYAQVTWNLAGIKDEGELYSKTFAGLFELGL